MHSVWRLIPVSVILLAAQGCSWFHDDRPPPQGSPYETGRPARDQVLSEAEAVNAAVSGISLRMAVSGEGPFQIFPLEKKTSALGHQVRVSLIRMRLDRPGASARLILEDLRSDRGLWTITLRRADGTIFYTGTFQLKEDAHVR